MGRSGEETGLNCRASLCSRRGDANALMTRPLAVFASTFFFALHVGGVLMFIPPDAPYGFASSSAANSAALVAALLYALTSLPRDSS